MARLERISQIETPASAPRYELRVRRYGSVGSEYEIWQLPAIATPQVTSALRVAGLRGRNLDLIEHRVLKRLAQAGVRPSRRARPQHAWLCADGGSGPDPGAGVPCAGADAQPRQHEGRGRRDRIHGTRGGGILARHGDAPQASTPGADGAAVSTDGAETIRQAGQYVPHDTE